MRLCRAAPLVQVATVKEETPELLWEEDCLSSYSEFLTIRGTGFDSNEPGANLLTFVQSQHNGSAVAAVVANATWTTLLVSFSALSPTNHGPLSAAAMVNHTATNSRSPQSRYNLVGNVYIETPALTRAATEVLTASATVTIFGTGFDYVNGENNIVSFTQAAGPQVLGEVREKPTRTSIVVHFTAIGQENEGALEATVELQAASIYRRRLAAERAHSSLHPDGKVNNS